VLYTAHGFHFHPLGNRVLNLLYTTIERMASRWTDVLVVINNEDAAAARVLFARPGLDIEQVPGVGVDTQAYAPVEHEVQARSRERLGVAGAGLVVGWVGEFIRRKRPGDVLKVARCLAGRVPDARFVMAGQGPLERETVRRSRSFGLEPTVLFPGWQGDVASFLGACDVVVSTASQEGLPRNILEAMACGLPVVAWNIRLSRSCGRRRDGVSRAIRGCGWHVFTA
jgi:glycosyltransferase EpsD